MRISARFILQMQHQGKGKGFFLANLPYKNVTEIHQSKVAYFIWYKVERGRRCKTNGTLTRALKIGHICLPHAFGFGRQV